MKDLMKEIKSNQSIRRGFIALLSTLLALVLLAGALGVFLLRNHYHSLQEKMIQDLGYYPLAQSMLMLGYTQNEAEPSSFFLAESGVQVRYDFENGKCYKNNYVFDIVDSYESFYGEAYINTSVLEKVFNANFSYTNGNISFAYKTYAQHEWVTAFAPFIAHAGGGMRHSKGFYQYTNSLDALVQNYNLGHRVFEIDFCFTTDGQLAAVHDWEELGQTTAAGWSAHKIKSMYTAMLLQDVLDQMMVCRDMFLVLDTKLYSPKEDVQRQFQIIYDEAAKRDPALLERIIPQIYNQSMYDVIAEIYEYPSIIYTLYSSNDTNLEAVDFVAGKERIQVLTVYYDRENLHELVDGLHAIGRTCYIHTLNQYEQMAAFFGSGVDGLYTDALIPQDYYAYEAGLNT